MPAEPLSPELALVDPELAARARAALPEPAPTLPRHHAASAATSATPPGAAPDERPRPRYPLWARLAATLWILVVGILIGGTAIPHAKDRPVLVPRSEDAVFCERPQPAPSLPARPLGLGSP